VAAPPTVGYRARKFIRKHRGPVIAAAAIGLALLLGVIGTTTMSIEANRQAVRARQSAAKEAARAESEAKAREAEAKARDAAELDAYIAGLAAAQGAIAVGDYPEARSRLNACPQSKRGWEWKFLRKQADSILYSLHVGESVHSFSRDAKRMLTSRTHEFVHLDCGTPFSVVYSDVTIRDPMTGVSVGAPIHNRINDVLSNAELSPDGTRLATSECELGDHFFRLWNAASGEPIRTAKTLDIFDSEVAHFSPSGTSIAIVGNQPNAVGICGMPTGEQIGKLMKHPARILSVVYSPDGSHLLTSCDDHAVRLWDATTGALVGEPMKHNGSIIRAQFSPNGSRILVASCGDNRRDVRLWDGLSGRAIQARIAPRIAEGDFDEANSDLLDYWEGARDAIGFERARSTDVGNTTVIGAPLPDAAFSRDGKRVMLACYDRMANTMVGVWDAATGKLMGGPVPIEPTRRRVAFLPAGDALFTFDAGSAEDIGGVSLWTLDGRRIGRSDPSFTTANSPDGNLILLTSPRNGAAYHGVVCVTDIDHFDTAIDGIHGECTDLEVQVAMEDGNSAIASRALPARPPIAVTLTTAGLLEIVEPLGHNAKRFIASRDGRIDRFAALPDGSRAIASCGDALRFYDTGTCRELAMFRLRETVKELKVTPDGTRLIVEFADNSAQIWDVRPLSERRKMWARLAAECAPARKYVQDLLSESFQPDTSSFATIRLDSNLSSMRKLMAIQLASHKMDQVELLSRSLSFRHLTKRRVIAAAMKEPDVAIRKQLLEWAQVKTTPDTIASKISRTVDQDDQPKDRYQAAAEAADELLATKPESTSPAAKRSTILRAIGAAYYRVGRYEEAIRLSRRAIAANAKQDKDDDASSWCWIAMSQFKLGQVKEAQQSLESATAALRGVHDEKVRGLLTSATKLIKPAQPAPLATEKNGKKQKR
jgi:WD40 repeat protein